MILEKVEIIRVGKEAKKFDAPVLFEYGVNGEEERIKAAAAAMKDTFDKDPIPTRGGGSIPIVALFEKELETKTVLTLETRYP